MERWRHYRALELMYDGPIPPRRLAALDRIEGDVVQIAESNMRAHRTMLRNKTARVDTWLGRYKAGHFTYGHANHAMLNIAAGVATDLLFIASQYLDTIANLNAAKASRRVRVVAE